MIYTFESCLLDKKIIKPANKMTETKQTTIQQLEQVRFLLKELTENGSIKSADDRIMLMQANLNVGEVLVHELSN